MIVVGVDGSDAAWQALDWAATEAERSDRELTIVHAGDLDPDGSALGDFAHELLADAVAHLAEDHPTVVEHTEAEAGDAADLLVNRSVGADLLVIGQTGSGRVARLLLGSTMRRALAHAQCPVVVVGEHQPPAGGAVVVGISLSEGGLAAKRFACTEARRRALPLIAVRSWSDPVWEWVGGRTPITTFADWRKIEQVLVERWLAGAHEEFPDVEIRTEVSSNPVYWELERYSQSAALLVLGCRHSAAAHLARLGPVATWAVRNAGCPVAVVGHPSIPEKTERASLVGAARSD